MEKINLEYLKADSFADELEIETFWIEIRKEILLTENDPTLLHYELKRGFAPAVIGEFAGIYMDIILIVPVIDSALSIWEKINNHFFEQRQKGKIIRILNLVTLENLCKYDLITSKNVKNALLVKSKKLVDNKIKLDGDYDFTYEESLKKIDCAKIIFKDNLYKYIYVISSDGEITSFKRKRVLFR